MKIGILAVAAVVPLVMLFGSPLVPASQRPALAQHWQSASAILPMSFAHRDHVAQNCLACHHNYLDDTGDEACMFCHVRDDRVADVLADQFHELCMGCHAAEQALGNPHGPVRRCVGCHLQETLP